MSAGATSLEPDIAATGRWELVRALGAICDTPAVAARAARALGLGELDGAAHTHVFVLNAPPYAAIHLGGEGMLGGEAADRVAGFWRTLGLAPPAEPDHLAALLALYAHLGEAGDDTARAPTRTSLTHIRRALLWEHLWAWVPGYAGAVADLAVPVLSPWADLLDAVLAAEVADGTGGVETVLPAALRDAPPRLDGAAGLDDLLDAMVAPVRSGLVLTRQALSSAGGEIGVGQRIGERRFTLRAMLEQDPPGVLRWLASEARRWRDRHLSRSSLAPGDRATSWWVERSAHSAEVLSALAGC
ncbi:MAG: molecular chaperone TorD family protein [Acidimicrobiales bacterium]